ncbi:Bet1-like SNARE 1-1 family protein [Striga asiatica]|uniref:Bet1-like SNARE 1-1 family protein n=1 Tax=Striga asiatica TaxID=4170 RepID=A0A5A7QGS8_STRAF|nr:Bet1-like SNARE 1-1 family protein [Striga asiatica]
MHQFNGMACNTTLPPSNIGGNKLAHLNKLSWLCSSSSIAMAMNSRRDRNSRSALFDGIEEGGIRASSTYSSHEIDEQENDRAVDGLQDRVNMLKRSSESEWWCMDRAARFDKLSGDIHEEVESHNLMLDRMGNDMDSSRGVLSGTMDKFKMVFETKSSRRMFTLVASFVVIFLVVYYLTR